MKTKDYYFDLPPELIAQKPLNRGHSRLLVYSRSSGAVQHRHISHLPEILSSETLIVVNNSFVRRARIYADRQGERSGSRQGARQSAQQRKRSGARQVSKVEFIFLQPLTEGFTVLDQGQSSRYWQVMARKAKRQVPGTSYTLPDNVRAEIVENSSSGHSALKVLLLSRPVGANYFAAHGSVPLPPYIRREAHSSDEQDYQTIFASKTGSVAAPTAGLHLSHSVLEKLRERGIRHCEITLHVGLGTFLPIRSDDLRKHTMHSEEYEIDEDTADLITEHKHSGKAILAVGTTSLRTLEAAWNGRRIVPGRSKTDLFIYPGYTFGAVDALLTNFHTPESTLLMLVSAFAGRETILSLYEKAIKEGYRFFSYGDACLFL
ncbi:MAG: tRNA preQ1(34) S-adenosylmethionine ribosyltransferase-isomerase QueA [Salinispira sp.]